MRKSGSLLYFLGSVGLIVVAIIFTALLQRTQNPASQDTDIRARAGNPTTLQMTARIVSVDSSKGVVIVDNLRMSDEDAENLGTWTVTPGENVNLSTLVAGRNVVLGVESSTFSIEKHTLRALEIRPTR